METSYIGSIFKVLRLQPEKGSQVGRGSQADAVVPQARKLRSPQRGGKGTGH